MTYKNIVSGRFLERPNRFIALVEISGKTHTVHVKNTGRCAELLVAGATVLLQPAENPLRKTAFDLISVYKGDRLINMDSGAPNHVVEEWLLAGGLLATPSLIKREWTFEDSRLDFYVEGMGRRIAIEVKGVTLEEDGVVRFPDAPTLRGIKHLEALGRCVALGYEAFAIFVVQMEGVTYFTPNIKTQPAFAAALKVAQAAGVELVVMDCTVGMDSLALRQEVPFIL